MTWITKGVSVGTLLFVLLSIVYVVVRIMVGAPATGTTALYGMTLQNPLYWLAFVLVLVVSCVAFRRYR